MNKLVSGIKSFIISIKKNIQNLLNDEKIEEKNDNDVLIEELNISKEKGKLFLNNIHMFEIIRKKIITKNYKLFNENLNNLTEINNSKGIPEKCRDNNIWNCSLNDKLLLYFIDEYGLSYLNTKINEVSLFQNCKLDYNEYISRINFLCNYFEEKIRQNKHNEKMNHLIQEQNDSQIQNTSNNIIKIKTSDFSAATDNFNSNIEISSNNELEHNTIIYNKIDNKLNVQRDQDGNIIYPIIINNNLKILNLGTIIYDNKNYHSEKNIFPLGYKSVREYQSMFNLQNRTEYTCEIIDGGTKPQYKVTCKDDIEHPIIRDSTTACWSYIVNKINELQGSKKKKVTINGIERFGLCESKVVRLISSLPNADKVISQMSKFDEDKKFNK